jgi:hypothetical protein
MLILASLSGILAHGFHPVDEPVYNNLYERLCSLVSLDHAGSQDWRLPAPG